MRAVVIRAFPYSDNGKPIKFKAGDTFDFPARQFNSLSYGGFILAECEAEAEVESVDDHVSEQTVKPKRGRRKERATFPVDGAGLVPELG